jgi:hypothetical protein
MWLNLCCYGSVPRLAYEIGGDYTDWLEGQCSVVIIIVCSGCVFCGMCLIW